jgi:hypothetical protein
VILFGNAPSIKQTEGDPVVIVKRLVFSTVVLSLVALAGCNSNSPQTAATPQPTPSHKIAGPLPDNGFKAQIEVENPPAKLRTGEKATIEVHIRNVSDVMWYARGGEANPNPDNRFYIAAGDRWLQPNGTLVTNMDARYGLDRDLKPGEETTVPLQITAPKDPGEYLLEIDLVQEQVSWFSDKGSPTARTKITVVR